MGFQACVWETQRLLNGFSNLLAQGEASSRSSRQPSLLRSAQILATEIGRCHDGHTPPTRQLQDHLTASLADRYVIERELGRGGMASVWLARDLRYDRVVALKVLDPDLAGAIGVERFVREIRVTAQIQHPNIVPVLDSGVCPGPDGRPLPWFAMTYVAGESLRQRLARERQLPIEEALRIADSVAAALQVAHDVEVVHRDIKPENILLAGGHTYVADFGIAKALLDTGSEKITSTGLVVGTPAYMSPEQASNDAVDKRSDQYALATVVYEMLAGEPPFTGPSAQAMLARRFAEPARPIRTVRSTVPASIEAAVLRALERVPADRFDSVSNFAAALHDTATRAPAPRKSWSRGRFAGAAALLIVAIAGGGELVAKGLRRGPAPPNAEALALFRRGTMSLSKRTPEGAAAALDAFKGAIRLDSSYGEAWAGLAKTYVQTYSRQFVFSSAARDSSFRFAVAAADRALAIDSSNADAWLTKSIVLREVDPTDYTQLIRALRRAVAMDSTLAQAWQRLAVAEFETGHPDDGLASWRKAVAVNPAYTEGLSFMALGHYWRRQYDSASHWADSAIAVDPAYLLARHAKGYIAVEQGDFARGASAFKTAERVSTDVELANSLSGEALVAARAGHREDALRVLTRAESLAAKFSPTSLHIAVYMALPYAALHDNEHAIAWLKRYEPSADLHFQLHIRCDAPFDAIASDPRFQALLLTPRPAPPHGC